jgi:hypothetical protein
MKEILDGWGRPIEFIRWPAGYNTSTVGSSTTQVADGFNFPDPFDPAKVDTRWSNTNAWQTPYALRPLIFSAGRNKVYDIWQDPAVYYQSLPVASDPYTGFTGKLMGQPNDGAGDGDDSRDNITNHFQETP